MPKSKNEKEESVSKATAKATASKEVKLATTKSTGTVVDKQNPPFDPDVPEQKQRWLR